VQGLERATARRYSTGCSIFQLNQRSSLACRQEDVALLQRAQAACRGDMESYAVTGTGRWLANPHVNAALACIQAGDTYGAKNLLVRMEEAAARDRTVCVYEVVWSSDRRRMAKH
jgi:hypothetical protein